MGMKRCVYMFIRIRICTMFICVFVFLCWGLAFSGTSTSSSSNIAIENFRDENNQVKQKANIFIYGVAVCDILLWFLLLIVMLSLALCWFCVVIIVIISFSSSSFLFCFDSNHQLYHFSQNLLAHPICTIQTIQMDDVILLYFILFDFYLCQNVSIGLCIKCLVLNQLYYCFLLVRFILVFRLLSMFVHFIRQWMAHINRDTHRWCLNINMKTFIFVKKTKKIVMNKLVSVFLLTLYPRIVELWNLFCAKSLCLCRQ